MTHQTKLTSLDSVFKSDGVLCQSVSPPQRNESYIVTKQTRSKNYLMFETQKHQSIVKETSPFGPSLIFQVLVANLHYEMFTGKWKGSSLLSDACKMIYDATSHRSKAAKQINRAVQKKKELLVCFGMA